MCLEQVNDKSTTYTDNPIGVASVDWEKLLQEEGLGMDRGKPNWLAYGHEYRDRINYEVRATSVSTPPAKKRLKPRQKAKLLVWGNPLPEAQEPPDWGYIGGYTAEGKKIRVSPGHHKAREAAEKEACSRIAVKSRRSRKSMR